MQYFSFDIKSYKADTAYLSNEEDICYRRLLDIYYDTERPLPDDPRYLSRQTRVSHAVVEDILREFFTLIDGCWHNARADAEIAAWYRRSSAAKANIEKRWEKREINAKELQKNNNGNTTVLQPNNERNTEKYELPTTSTSTTTKVNPSCSNPAGFDRFWALYPRKVGKAKAISVWNRLKVNGKLEQVLAAVEAQKKSEQWTREGGRFIPHPTTWLNEGRWDDEPDHPVATQSRFAGVV